MTAKISDPVSGSGKMAESRFLEKLRRLFAWANGWRAVYPVVLDQRNPTTPTVSLAQDFIVVNGVPVPAASRPDGGFRLGLKFEIDGMTSTAQVENGVLVIKFVASEGSGS